LAGTTLLAVSYSAPEVFISLVGVFIGDSDISINTLLGCSTYNLLVITSTLCFCAYKFKICLIKETLLKDIVFYLFSLLVILFILLRNEFSEFNLYESLVLMFTYLIYVWITNYELFKNIFRTNKQNKTNEMIQNENNDQEDIESLKDLNYISTETNQTRENGDQLAQMFNMYEEPYDFRKEYKKIAFLPMLERTKLIITFPSSLFVYITVIDFRRFEKRRIIYVIFSIVSCMILISISCYVIIWMGEIISETWNVTELIMGFVFVSIVNRINETRLAIKKCKQDLKQSISSEEDSQKLTTSLSNTFASNIFSLSMGLGISYFLNALLSPNKYIFTLVKNQNLLFVLIGSIVCAILLIIFLYAFRWKLKKYLGLSLLFIWSIYNVLIILIELNFFKINLNIFRKCN